MTYIFICLLFILFITIYLFIVSVSGTLHVILKLVPQPLRVSGPISTSIFGMNAWLLGTQKVSKCLEGCKKSWWGKGRATWPFFWSPSSLLWLLNSSWSLGCSLIYWWAARLSLTHRCLPLRGEQGSTVPPGVLNSLSQRMGIAQVPGLTGGSQSNPKPDSYWSHQRSVFSGTPGESKHIFS